MYIINFPLFGLFQELFQVLFGLKVSDLAAEETFVSTQLQDTPLLNPSDTSRHEVPRPLTPLIVNVSADERKQIMEAGRWLKHKYGYYHNYEFVAVLHMEAFRLMPERIIRILSDFASDFDYDQYGAIVFRGLVDVDQEFLGPTPPTWRETDFGKIADYEFISAMMHAVVRAVPIQQYYQREGGGFLHSVIPNLEMIETQTGEGSKTPLLVHTEDACLHSNADYLTFLYLRNYEGAPSMLHSIRSHSMLRPYIAILFKSIFKCPMDGNYKQDNKNGSEKTIPVLFGNKLLPFYRFDPAEQLAASAEQCPEAQEALSEFWKEAEKLIYTGFIPEPGDLVFANNKLCGHGRSAFTAGYKKENDQFVPCERRWMLRMMSTASLMNFYEYAETANPFLGYEKHIGSRF